MCLWLFERRQVCRSQSRAPPAALNPAINRVYTFTTLPHPHPLNFMLSAILIYLSILLVVLSPVWTWFSLPCGYVCSALEPLVSWTSSCVACSVLLTRTHKFHGSPSGSLSGSVLNDPWTLPGYTSKLSVLKINTAFPQSCLCLHLMSLSGKSKSEWVRRREVKLYKCFLWLFPKEEKQLENTLSKGSHYN